MEIALIVDNETPPGLVAEHGFAAWIDTGDGRLLFDTGQGAALAPNAAALGIDLGEADALILSHGHYDHTGGIPAFLAANATAPVYSGKGAKTARFSCHPDQAPRAIGMAEAVCAALDTLPAARRIELDAPYRLRPGIGITGPIPRLCAFEDTGGPFFLDTGKTRSDLIGDDLSMWFETARGLVILSGCCHSGLVNTVNHIRRITGIERIHGIVGGLHLLNASAERLDATLRFIAECRPDFLVPCHCTGAQVAERLQREFGAAAVTVGHAGLRLSFAGLRDAG